LAFSLKMRKTATDVIEERIKRAAGILHLAPMLDRYPAQLSGGQRQRVAMGRALVREPQVFLFDEPLSNLDAKLRVEMRSEIKALHQRLETTTIYVTHDQIEAMTMADVVVVMHEGRIEQVGAPLEIYDHPHNIFVAEFLGSPAMNILSGEVVLTDSGPAVEARGIRLPLPPAAPVTPGSRIAYGFRPEHVRLSTQDGPQATVTLVEPAGWETHVHLDLNGETIRLVSTERVSQAPGETAHLTIDRDRVHLFDVDTGRRL
jgi:multiple sugar transport system ATP-binding protein